MLAVLTLACACAPDAPPALEGAAAEATRADDTKPPADDDDGECGQGPTAALVTSWHGLSSASAELVLTAPRLTLDVENVSREPLEARVLYALDLPAAQAEPIVLATIALAAGERTTVTVDLGQHAASIAKLRFAAGLRVFVEPFDVERRQALEAHHALPLYFHPTAAGLAVYGEDVLRKAHRSGDFLRLLDDAALFEDGARTERVIEAGAGVVGPHITANKIDGDLR